MGGGGVVAVRGRAEEVDVGLIRGIPGRGRSGYIRSGVLGMCCSDDGGEETEHTLPRHAAVGVKVMAPGHMVNRHA